MSFDPSGFSNALFLSPPSGGLGYVLAALYVLGLLAALTISLPEWPKLRAWQWLALVGLGLAGMGLAQLLIVRFDPYIPPVPGLPIVPKAPGLALLAFAPAFIAAGWIGVGPAIVVGFITGLGRALWETYSVLTPFEYALIAFGVACAVRQDYAGWPARLLRSPLISASLAAIAASPLLFLSYAAYTEAQATRFGDAADFVVAVAMAGMPVLIGQAVMGGLVAELVRLVFPALWIRRRGLQPPPYLYSLNRKLLFALVPLFLFGLVALFIANVSIAQQVATDLSLRQMERAAEMAGRDIPFFIQTGNGLMLQIANGQDWFALDNATQNAALLQSMRAMPFFKQLTLLDASLNPVAGQPQMVLPDQTAGLDAGQRVLAEQALIGAPQTISIFRSLTGADDPSPVDIVFLMPVPDPATRQPIGVLMGTAALANSPLMQSTFSNFGGATLGGGNIAATEADSASGITVQGFLLNENNQIIYHPVTASVQQLYLPEPTAPKLATRLPGALAFQDRAPDGTRRLALRYPLPGYPWTAVITVPMRSVLELSIQIATPIVGLLLVGGLIGLVLVSAIALRLARPAEELALAAQRISESQLEQPVKVRSEDEIGRAGAAFERMRQRLRARLFELNLLLDVSQSVSSGLDVRRSLPHILQGALKATNASGARIVLVPAEGMQFGPATKGDLTFADGPLAPSMAPLDRGLLDLTRRDGRAVIEHLNRARAVLDVSAVAGKLQALIALPLRQENSFYGTLWLGFDQPHTFSDAEINFLTTLSSQAAVAVANARLFSAAEHDRRNLATIVNSTPDAVIVTDPHHRVLLLNPAAQHAFDLIDKPVAGRALAEVLPNAGLAQMMMNSQGPVATGEFEAVTGRILYASVSPIVGVEGEVQGRVCVLRDVTHFKEVDMMKSEFVATVSHDLRAPLTFMRGYATMMPMVGTLNDKQKEFADKIIAGIEQMTKLIDDLLDLGRIEAGVGLATEPCRLDDIVHGIVDTLAPVASNKGLALDVDVPANLPLMSGDPTLLRQAITNLLDNAIKYTPGGGQVRVRLIADNGKFRVAVSDSGMGIAPADQAHLFEKFFRVKQRGSSHVKGSGLGLAIVKSVAERHGGRVWVDSKLGKGSTFYLEVPRDPSHVAQLAGAEIRR
jgi:PAS domain S-box-containing protein